MNLKNKIFKKYLKETILESENFNDLYLCEEDIQHVLDIDNISLYDNDIFPLAVDLITNRDRGTYKLIDIYPLYEKDTVVANNIYGKIWRTRSGGIIQRAINLSKKDFRNYKLTKLLNEK